MKSKRPKLKGPVPDRIKTLRLARSLTQEDLASENGVDKTSVSHWENGTPVDVKRLPRLAETLGVTVEQLIEGESEYAFIATLSAKPARSTRKAG